MTLIAQGDVALSIVMTVCTTLGAVLLTPTLTKILVGTYVPVDALKLSISTLQVKQISPSCLNNFLPFVDKSFGISLQVVVLPILLGSYMQSKFPKAVKLVTPFSPLFTVLAASLLACRCFKILFTDARLLISHAHFLSCNLKILNLFILFQCVCWKCRSSEIVNCWCISVIWLVSASSLKNNTI